MPEKETKNGGKNCRRGDWISKTFAELSPERKKIECKWIFSRNIESLLSSRNRDGRGTYILIHVDELILDPEFRIRKTDLEPRRYHYLEMKLSFQPKKTRLLEVLGHLDLKEAQRSGHSHRGQLSEARWKQWASTGQQAVYRHNYWHGQT